VIEVQSVSKSYGKKKNIFKALDDVSFTIPDGASVAIVGKSGSGKSTLMHVMSGLDTPEVGKIVIDDKNILEFKQKEVDQFRSNTMAFIFQSFFVEGNESCYNNVSLPLEIAREPMKDRSKKIEKALEAVELLDKKKSRARDLSGGQKQRHAIARAIVNQPKILFADEPTGNLDSATGDTIESLLFQYNKENGTTLIIVTHDIDLAKKCDIQIYIKDGEVQKILGVTS
jgi:putative ABC transport system ATP-binding protein